MTKPSFVPKLCTALVFDCLQYTKPEGEGKIIEIIEIIEAFYLCFCILQAIKNWTRQGLGMRLDQTRAIANSVDMVVKLMHVARGDLWWLIKGKGALLRYGSQLVKFNCVLPPFGKLAKSFLSLTSHTLHRERKGLVTPSCRRGTQLSTKGTLLLLIKLYVIKYPCIDYLVRLMIMVMRC